MDLSNFRDSLSELFERKIEIEGNFISLDRQSQSPNQQQTNDAFSDKWSSYGESRKERLYQFQRRWYLTLYGFSSEDELRASLWLSDHI